MATALGESLFLLLAGLVGGVVAYLLARRTSGSLLAHLLIALAGFAAVLITLIVVLQALSMV